MMMTKKRILSILTLLVLLCTIGSTAFAAKKTATEDQKTILAAMVEVANVAALVAATQGGAASKDLKNNELTKLINEMQTQIKAINAPVLKYAKDVGLKVQCEKLAVDIGGRHVMVDPLKVINK